MFGKYLKSFVLLAALLLPALSFAANRQRVRNLDITFHLMPSGGIVVSEIWDINTGDDITEWYLVRENLGDIEIGNLRVLDETGKEFENIGEWDIHRTLEEKAGRCGVVHKSDGVELCWGIGSHGDHKFYAFYWMMNAIKGLNDYDMLHLQVVSPGLSSPPEHVRVTFEGKDVQLDTLNTRAWAFGFIGHTVFEDGKVVMESDGPLDTEDSVIGLLRLDKGLFQTTSMQERDFQEALDIAMEEADFGVGSSEENKVAAVLAYLLTFGFLYFLFIHPFIKIFHSSGISMKTRLKNVLGVKKLKDVQWFRDIPLEGDLPMARRVLEDAGQEGDRSTLAQAVILRLVHTGYLQASREVTGPFGLTITDKDPQDLDSPARDFLDILKKAAGADGILQEKEFSQWARNHLVVLFGWMDTSDENANARLMSKGWKKRGLLYSAEGQRQARNLIGLKTFLADFTLMDKRETFEVNLWKEYLVYAALFGIADKVASQLKDIDPKFFQEVFPYDAKQVISLGRAMSYFVQPSPPVSHSYSSSSSSSYSSGRSGRGGSSSHGGGRGFSGGGRGGGGR